MGFREIEYVLTIAKYQNITRAAEALHVTQPTLSKFLIAYEEKQKQKLFRRVGNKYLLTAAGEVYVDKASQILRMKEDLDREMELFLTESQGTLKIGFPPSRMLYMAPVLLVKFEKLFPKVKVCLKEASSQELEQDLIEGNLDLVFFNQPLIPDSHILYEKISSEEFVICCRKDHPITQKAKHVEGLKYPVIARDDLKNERFLILRPNQRTGQMANMVIRENNLEFSEIIEVGSVGSMLEIAASGYGICFGFDFHAKLRKSEREIACFQLEGKTYESPFVAARRRDGFVPDYAAGFIELVKNIILP